VVSEVWGVEGEVVSDDALEAGIEVIEAFDVAPLDELVFDHGGLVEVHLFKVEPLYEERVLFGVTQVEELVLVLRVVELKDELHLLLADDLDVLEVVDLAGLAPHEGLLRIQIRDQLVRLEVVLQ